MRGDFRYKEGFKVLKQWGAGIKRVSGVANGGSSINFNFPSMVPIGIFTDDEGMSSESESDTDLRALVEEVKALTKVETKDVPNAPSPRAPTPDFPPVNNWYVL